MILPATLRFPAIDPFLFRVGPVGLSWYAFMYLLGFTCAYFLLRSRYQKGLFRLPHEGDVSLLILYCLYGLVLGARIGYILFYNLKFYLHNPWEIPAVWHGGMSFHGGLIGTILAIFFFSRRVGVPFYHVGDQISLCAPIGLGFGRIGNFINGELYGRITNVPWAMVFPRDGTLPRHPSQLYEALFEGPILWLILYGVSRSSRDGSVSAALLISYGVLRFFIEFFREPDPQLGTVLGPFSLGQVLCLGMILAGFLMLLFIPKRSRDGIRDGS